MIHIVFQAADVDVLQKAIELDDSLQGDIIRIKDDYAVGPLGDLNTPEGWQGRRDWWKGVLEYAAAQPTAANVASAAASAAANAASAAGATGSTAETDTLDMVEDKMTVHRLKTFLDEQSSEEAWIWMAQNQHDVCGYYWLVSQLAAYQGRIQVLYLNNLPFLNEKGNIFYPTSLFEIQPSEFRKAKKLARSITLSEFEIDPDEWVRLSQENAGVRLLEGGKKIAGQEYSFYDKDLLAALSGNWQKFNRVLNNTLNRMKIKVGDVFMAWRLRTLVAEGKVELNGDPAKGWNSCEIKLPGAAPAAGAATVAGASTETPQNI